MESGKHAELMARKGEYYQLVTVQMLVEEEMEEGQEEGLFKSLTPLVDSSILTNWTSPFPVLRISGVFF